MAEKHDGGVPIHLKTGNIYRYECIDILSLLCSAKEFEIIDSISLSRNKF